MNRRDLLKLGAMAGIAASFPLLTAHAGTTQPALPIPPLLEPNAQGLINLAAQTGTSLFRGNTPTPTWGINGPLLGPALKLKKGQNVTLRVKNTLPETTTIHWHGMEVPGIADGGPQATIQPGANWEAAFTVAQPAATCWFHPHLHGKTGFQVAMGLGGLILVEDEISTKLPLPNRWGVDDIPLIIQDKRLTDKNTIDYQLDVMAAAVGWFGDILLTNGAPSPQHNAGKGWLRFRVLNGCNARSLKLAVSDKRPMYVIASDGGFLAEPVKVHELPLFMGERFEILVDASNGKAFDLITLPVEQMGMALPPFDLPVTVLRVYPNQEAGKGQLPDKLATLPALPKLSGLPTRTFQLTMDHALDMAGMMELRRRYGDKAMTGMHGNMMMQGGNKGHSGMMMQEGNTEHSGMMKDGNREHSGMMMQEGNRKHSGMMMQGQADMSEDGPHMMHQDAQGGMMHGGGMMGGHKGQGFDLHTANRINGRAFVMDSPQFDVKQGQYERWVVSSKGDAMLHPFHVHGAQFRIISEHGRPPAPHRSGWKDTVVVEDSESEILIRFAHLAPKERAYMAHCHLLEHEDTGMMLSFTVSK